MQATNILRINQEKLDLNRYRVELSYQATRANAEFEFSLSEQEQEDLRWYLEEYLMYPDDANTERANSIETFMRTTGETLTEKVLESDRTTRRLWNTCLDNLNDMRIEVETSVEAATSIPWELLYVPEIKNYLCLEAQSFVRSYREGARITDPDDSEVVRVLLVICRPNAGNDVPFRSVASRIIKSLGTSINERVELDVLRPATYESLGAKLRAAQLADTPYHIVHFDGHGTYKNVVEETDASQLSEIRYGDRGGYLIFEDPKDDNNREYVDGIKLGELLAQTDVPMLVLNACQSAYAEARSEDDPDDDHTTDTSEKRKSEVEAYGSLAQQVMAAGVSGVVAMRYSVYVVTAAQFVADLYNTLAQGFTLGQAVNMGRKRLNDQPERKVRHDPIPLRDWMVPIVFERAPLQLLPRQESTTLTIGTITNADGTTGQQSEDDQLPRTPDLGFFGRDETLLALDRTFDSKHVALLYAYAGSGKTTTAAEFARWYNLTGGIKNGVVIFTSFEQYRPLENVLSDFGRVLGPTLQANGIPWHAIIDKAERRQVVLSVLAQLPVLWIWDNVEGVHGFPRGTDSQWSGAEQQELADFLRDAKNTQAKFLLTSRLDEREWLGDFLPKRIPMRPMPMWERVQMADKIVRHADRRFEWTVWQPLLQYTGGNPLTLQVLVTQAVRDKIRTQGAMRAFVGQLRRGEVNFQDDTTQGRSKSLGASLAYGYDAAFSEEERAQLAVLHLFQGFVDANALVHMGYDINDNTLSALNGKDGQYFVDLLNKASKIGVLRKLDGSYYDIHPALPWFLKSEFETHYPTLDERKRAQLAYTQAIGYWGNEYMKRYINGQRDVIHLLAREEANLLHARRFAINNQRWGDLIKTMQGIRMLYNLHGRQAERRYLVEEIIPFFCHPETEMPLPERTTSQWSLVMQYRVRILQEERDWEDAERLQLIRTTVWREATQAHCRSAYLHL
ncbi:MAG: CHAT domain-containing protein [Chloroflexota bacterium]